MTGIYFSIYAVGMVGTAYGIYSLAFVCPNTYARIADSNVPFAVQADEKGLNTRIDLILACLQCMHTLVISLDPNELSCVKTGRTGYSS